MRKKAVHLFVLGAACLMIFSSTGGESQENRKRLTKFPVLRGKYLGQKKPGLNAELFAPGIISTGYTESCAAFTPDGKELYFLLQESPYGVILVLRQENNQWTAPRVAPFSGRYTDWELTLAPDGNKLVFISNRPQEETGKPKKDWDIWMVVRTDSGWSKPQSLGPTINSDKRDAFPSLSNDGTLYFSSNRVGGKGGWDIYRSALVDGHYTKPECLGYPVNSEVDEWDPFIAPDQGYIIFGSRGRDDGYGGSDLYISFRKKDGSWSEVKNMGAAVNSNSGEYCPSVSPDGKYIFFTSFRSASKSYSEKPLTYDEILKMINGPRNGGGDIYWVDAKIIRQLKVQCQTL